MKKHLVRFEFDCTVSADCYCGVRLFRGDKHALLPADLTPENEREVCKTCLRAYSPDMFPKEFTDTF